MIKHDKPKRFISFNVQSMLSRREIAGSRLSVSVSPFLFFSLALSLSPSLSLSLPFCCSEGATALHWAATTGHVSVMKELLKLKARQLQLDSASVGLNRETQDFTFPNLPWWSSVPQIIGAPNQEEGRRHHNLWAVLHE